MTQRNRATTIALIAFCFVASDAKSCVIDGDARGMMVRAGQHLRSDKSLDDLEACSQFYRNGQSTFETGEQKLTTFYNGLASIARLMEIKGLYQSWQQRYPQSPAPKLLAARDKVFDAMGSLDAALVQPGHTQDFMVDASAVKEADQALEAIRDVSLVDPYWFVLKFQLLLISERNDAQAREIMLKGIRRFPEFADLYTTSANYFLPKWGGTSEALEAWARDAARESSNSPRAYAYARIYTQAIRAQYSMDIFKHSRADWPAIKADAHDMLEHYPASANIAPFTMAACVAGDHEETARLVALKPNSSDLGDWLTHRGKEACVEWAKKTPLAIKLERFSDWITGIYWRIAALADLAYGFVFGIILVALERLYSPR